jgi:hypothetical protein
LTRPNPEVTPQVESSGNLLNGKSLKELVSALGFTIVQVTPQVTPQVEKVLTVRSFESAQI